MKLKLLFIAIYALLVSSLVWGQEPGQPPPRTGLGEPSITPVNAMRPDPTVSIGSSKGYQLGPGDQVTVVTGEKEYDFIATIDEDGKLDVPYPDEKPIVARCMTERDLRAALIKALEKYLRYPQVNIRTERRSRPQATVYGEVNYPTRFDMNRKATLVELLAFAGGVREEAAGIVQVSRPMPPLCAATNDPDNWKTDSPDPTIVPSRIFRLADIKLGTEGSNPIVYPGDVIYVHKAAPVYLTGEVFSPQGIYLKDTGLTVTQAIAKVGGLKSAAKRKEINIRRLKPGTNDQYDIISANYDLIMKGQQKDVLLRPYDIVEVDKAKPGIAKTILDMATGAARTGVSSLSTVIGYRVIPL
jgi:protein involved in polysaccharide export with SLBB domain